MFQWLEQHAASVQALASTATVLITLALAAITWRYVRLTQQLVAANRQQLRFQQQTERSGAVQLLTLIDVFLGNLARLPSREDDVERLRDVSIWRHGDVSTFGSLAAPVLGSFPPVHQAIQALNSIRAKVDAVRQIPPAEHVTTTFSWQEWTREITRAASALRQVRDAAEAAESSLSSDATDEDRASGRETVTRATAGPR